MYARSENENLFP